MHVMTETDKVRIFVQVVINTVLLLFIQLNAQIDCSRKYC